MNWPRPKCWRVCDLHPDRARISGVRSRLPPMKNNPADETANQTHARSLLADIEGASDTLIPRRETIVEWLKDYLYRSHRRGYVVELAETDDLVALDAFLRSQQVPAAVPPAA